MRTYSALLQPARFVSWRSRAALYLGRNPVERAAIEANHELRGRHNGSRCFILGNGPSLRDEDLSLLAGEFTFTVNNLVAERVGAPSPSYHVISDRRFFSADGDTASGRWMRDELTEIVSARGECDARPPTTFVPSSEKGRLEGFLSGHAHDLRYFCNPFYFSDYYQIDDDITSVIPRFSSVIQHAILIAAFMGFEEIYLLGCDATNIVANISTALETSVESSYAYEVTSELDSWLRLQYDKRNMERCAESFLEVMIAFRFISYFADKRGIKLVNCSSKTVVDSIARAKLRDIL